jgi:hypothetical protein
MRNRDLEGGIKAHDSRDCDILEAMDVAVDMVKPSRVPVPWEPRLNPKDWGSSILLFSQVQNQPCGSPLWIRLFTNDDFEPL